MASNPPGQAVIIRSIGGVDLSVDSQGRLNIVLSSGDIQVGALEIKDGASDLRCTVVDNGDGTYSLKTKASLDSSIPITIGAITAPVGISGDVSIIPKAGQVFPVNDNSGSLTVDGTVSAAQSGSWSIASSGDIAIVDGTTRSQKATVYTSGAIRVSGDRYESRTGDYGTVSVTTSPVIIGGGRKDLKGLVIVPMGTIYLGLSNSVSSSTGTIMFSGDVYTDGGEGMFTADIYGVTNAGTVDTRYQRRW